MTEQKTILLVEDEALIAMSEAMLLRNAGYEVLLAHSGEKAIEQVHRDHQKIDLILMDINLGSGMDGTQAAEEILKIQEIPILFLSSHIEPEIVAKTEKITSYGYVVKDSGFTVLEVSMKMAFKLHAANQAVYDTNEKLNLALEGSRAATWDWNVAKNLFDWSPEFRQLIGLSSDQPTSLEAFMRSIHPDDVEMVAQQIQDGLKHPNTAFVDYRVVLPNQEIRWLETTGKTYFVGDRPLRMTGICMDITDRKRAEEAIQVSELKYRTLISEMVTGFSLNRILYAENGAARDYVTLEVNKAFETFLNVNRAVAVGRAASEFLPPEELQHWLAIFAPVVQTKSPAHYELYSPINGKTFEGQAYYAGKDLFAVTFTDITECKQTKTALRECEERCLTERKQAEDQIRQVLHEKELLLREVHHRMKNNMTNIASLLSIQADMQPDAVVKKDLQVAAGRIHSMMVLYDKLYRSIDYNTVSLLEYIPALLRELVELYPHREEIQVQTRLEEISLPQKILSPLGIILNELTTNAIKYAFAGQADATISVSAARNADRIQLVFADNGVGLPEQYNFTNSPGFGMQLVYMLVQQIHGTVTIRREHGTSYLIEFSSP